LDLVFSPLGKALGFAVSPTGRRAIRGAIRAARSEEAKKLVSQAHKVATSPEARQLVGHAKRAAGRVSETAKAPENVERLERLKRSVRNRVR
jgi:cell division septum initiation protein DivIVA